VRSETVPVYGSPELYPIHFFDEGGNAVGYWVDVLDELSRRTDIKFKQKLIGVREGRDKIVNNGERALLGVILTSSAKFDRYKGFDFSEPLGEFNLRFYSSSTKNLTWIDLKNLPKRIAVIGRPGAFAKGWLERNSNEQIEFLEVDSFEDGLSKVLANEADAFFGAEWATRFAYNTYFKSDNGLIEGPIIFTSGMAFASNAPNRDLIFGVNQVLSQPDFQAYLLETYLKWLPHKPLSPSEYISQKQHNFNDTIIVIAALSLGVIFMGILFVIWTKYNEKAKLQRISTLSIRSTLHDLADPLNAILSAKGSDTAIIENAHKQIDMMMQYHRMLLTSENQKLNRKKTFTLQSFFEQQISNISSTFPVVTNINFLEVGPETAIQANLDALSIVLHNIVKNAYQHGTGTLNFEININQSKKTNLVIIASNQIAKSENSAESQNKMSLEHSSFKHGMSIINDTVELAGGSSFYRRHESSFIIQVQLPVIILEQSVAATKKNKKLQISKASTFVIIDDSEYTLNALSQQLTDLGFGYFALNSEDKFAEFCAQNNEKLADNFIFLIDKNLRSVSGFELLYILIDKFNVSASDVIMMSGEIFNHDDELVRSIQEGVLVISKPFKLIDYLEILP
jgi:ABC-type amino acid transport substrate-binding protein/two-component sensor histidine kinase